MAKSKELATNDQDIPAYLQALQDQGIVNDDNFDASDVAIPQVKLLQGTSEQVTLFDDARAGEYWHTGLDTPLGSELKFIVCSRRKKYLLQAPMDDGQGVVARADDAKTWDRLGEWEIQVDKKTRVVWKITDLDVEASGLTQWGTYDPEDPKSPPAATIFYEYLVLLPDHLDLGPAVISLARSSIRKAKKGLNDKIALHEQNGRPLQSIQFKTSAVVEQNEANQDFFNWSFTGAGFAEENLYDKAVHIGKTLSTYTVKDEGQQDAAPVVDSDEI